MDFLVELTGLTRVCVGYGLIVIIGCIVVALEDKRGEC
jgi:hypothetical protein